MKFVLASHNKGKLAEMQAVLADLGIEVVMPADLGIYVDVEETGETFAENAALKANAIMEASGLPAIAALGRKGGSNVASTGWAAHPASTPPATAGWTMTRPATACCCRTCGAPRTAAPISTQLSSAPSPMEIC